MRLVISDAGRLERFKTDPQGYTSSFASQPGNEVTVEELQALSARDFARLYQLGAHPFLLWTFTEFVWTPEQPREDVVRRYKEATASIGYPDFST